MKMKVHQAAFATLSLTIDLLASQRVFHNVILKSICETDEKYQSLLAQINEEVKKERELVRAVAFQFAEVHLDDLLNGTFEV